ncbi:MAG: peptide chain release factor 1 [Phycisphaerae bacterium]
MSKVEGPLLAKLESVQARHDALTHEMSDPAVLSNSARVVQITKELARLRRVVEPFARLRSVRDQIAQAETIRVDPASDAEFRALAEADLETLQPQAERLTDGLIDELLAGDEADVESVILEIRAGTGGEEAALFAGDLAKMYEAFARARGLKWDVMDASASDLGGYREFVVNVKGPGVYQLLGYEGGGHRVQRVPETEAQGRIHTSAATVAVLPEAEQTDVKVDWDKDVLEHVSCAGGPGGQNVNKVASAIKLEHKATGITVSMRDERSQHKNRDRARRILLTRLRDFYVQRDHAERSAKRKTMIGSGDRNERVRTYNFPQSRCTDHRINENYPLDPIMAGKLDELVAALRAFDRAQRLREL